MTTYNTTIAPTQSTDAAFRTLVAAIRDSIDMVLTRTGDTGQIDTTTVVRPAVANTAGGYNMWVITGGSQPVYFKLEYGRLGNITDPGLWVQFGTATNGAGTLSGATTSRRILDALTASATAFNCYFSGGTGYFGMVLWNNHTTSSSRPTVSFERDWLADGTASEDYYYAIYHFNGGNNNQRWNRCVRVTGDVYREHQNTQGTWPSEFATSVLGADIALYPIRPLYGTERNPSRTWAVVGTTDVASGTIFSADLYGVSHTWFRTAISVSGGIAVDTNHVLCLRWE